MHGLRFEMLQTVAVNGAAGRPNEDRAGASGHLAWVIDGATDLGPPGLLGRIGGASWLAGTADRAFAAAEDAQIGATCETVFRLIDERFERDRTREVAAAWELPRAAFAAARLSGEALEVARAADCAILQATQGGVRWCTGAPDTAAEAAEAAALGEGIGALPRLDGPVLADRRAHRARDDQSAIGPDALASARATRFAAGPVSVGDDLLLMTDGFARLVTDFRRYSAETLIEAVRARGLSALVTELRQIEQEDAGCIRYPRFKISDDATALWVTVAD